MHLLIPSVLIKFIARSTVYCLLCQFYDVLIHCCSFADLLCLHLWLRMFLWQGNIERINFRICVWCLHICIFLLYFCVGIGFIDLTRERMRRVHLCTMEFSCPDVKIQLLTYIWVPHVRSDLHPNTSAWMLSTCTCVLDDIVTGRSCCTYSRDKFSCHGSYLRPAASQVLDVSTNAPRVFGAAFSGKILWRFEPIHLIFNVLVTVYNGIHNLLLAVSVSWCADQLFLSFADPLCLHLWPWMLFWQGQHWRDQLRRILCLCMYLLFYVCRDGFCEFDLSKAEKSF